MIRLSVNINKVALIRNARGQNFPDLVQYARDCENVGAQGITVHPRPDQRHIRYNDLQPLKSVVQTELNIEGNPIPQLMDLVEEVRPHQMTLVPDAPDALTSDSGWDTIKHQDFLQEQIARLKRAGIRTSLFIDPIPERIEAAAEAGADRIELYTGPYAASYFEGKPEAELSKLNKAAEKAVEFGLGVNAGHDLNLANLPAFVADLGEYLSEVSIGHALTVDALYYGLENAIQMYLEAIHRGVSGHS